MKLYLILLLSVFFNSSSIEYELINRVIYFEDRDVIYFRGKEYVLSLNNNPLGDFKFLLNENQTDSTKHFGDETKEVSCQSGERTVERGVFWLYIFITGGNMNYNPSVNDFRWNDVRAYGWLFIYR